MNFLFVDRILKFTAGKEAIGLKHVTSSDFYLTCDSNQKNILIPCIIGEAIGQLCSWNVIKSSDFELRLIGGVVGEVLIHDYAYVGDTVILENQIDTLDLANQVVHFHGCARVGDRMVLEVKNGLGPLLPVADFGGQAKVRRDFNYLYQPGPIPAIQAGYPIPSFRQTDLSYLNYDRMILWEKGRKVIAQKNISLLAPYFDDHFPHRPVLPLSLLIESHLQLAYPFLEQLLDKPKQEIIPMAVRRIKMNDFVEAGAMLLTHMLLKTCSDNTVILTFRSETNERRVCICEAEFKVKA